MTFVLIVSLALVALLSESEAWAGGVYLVTYAVLLLAIVGAVCRTGSERAWWLGFALFGFAYFRWTLHLGLKLPTTLFLEFIRPAGVGQGDFRSYPLGNYWLIGHCLWSLLAATFGGVLAAALFAVPKAQPDSLDVEPRQEARPTRLKWRRAAAIGLALFVPLSAMILVSPLSDPALWTSALYLSTWALLGITVLGFACGRGKRRMIWFGAALFGLGYMVLNRSGDGFEEFSYVHLVADEFLEAVRPRLPEIVRGFPAKSAAMAGENARIREILERKIPMRFREETSLETVLDHIRTSTKAADGRELPIYVDPQGLQDADKTMQSVVQIDLEASPLDTTLRLALGQLGLFFSVINGMVYITSSSSPYEPAQIDYYLLAGHCFLALLSAGLGAFLVPLISHRET